MTASVRANACGIVLGGDVALPCLRQVPAGAALNLCAQHLLEAYEAVAGEVGVTDVLPSPCVACGSRLGVRYASGWLCAVCEWRYGEMPYAEWAPPRVDVVYYIGYGDRVKIGTSSNPRARLAQLSYERLLAFEHGDRSREQRRHAQFAAHRIGRGEWFEANDDLSRHIETLSAGVDDPWSLYQRWLSEAIAAATPR